MEKLGFFPTQYCRCLHISLAVLCQFHNQMPEPSHLGISTKLTIYALSTQLQQEIMMHLRSRKDALVFHTVVIVN